jgi:hypothetical protein
MAVEHRPFLPGQVAARNPPADLRDAAGAVTLRKQAGGSRLTPA